MNSFPYDENFFSSSVCLQLADFGLSNHFKRDSLLQTYCGSPLYAAPEIVKGLPYQGPEVGRCMPTYTIVYLQYQRCHFVPVM